MRIEGLKPLEPSGFAAFLCRLGSTPQALRRRRAEQFGWKTKKCETYRIEPFCLRSSRQIAVNSRFGVDGKITIITGSVNWSTKAYSQELLELMQILMGETPSRSFSAGVFSAVLAGILGGLVMVRNSVEQFSTFTFITCS